MTTLLQQACADFIRDEQERDSPAYTRGLEYQASDRVRIEEMDDEHVSATVSGTEDYNVRLVAGSNGGLDTDCTCPVGQRAEYCKHVVAVALSVAYGQARRPRAAKARAEKPAAAHPAPAIIDNLDIATLRTLLRDAAENDKGLRDRILLLGATQDGPDAMARQWKTGMKNACSARGFVDWRRMGELARGIDRQLNVLDDWMAAGQSALVISLAEYAADRVEGLIGKVDDSDGSIAFLLTRISELHRRACAAARPEPRELAKRLFKRECDGGWDTFRDAVVHYADVLGDTGIATFRRLAEPVWAKITPLKPGQLESRYDSGRFAITRIMENLARRDGDVDALVQVYARDLSLPYGYLQIAEALLEAGRGQEALQWAETGQKAFATGHRDERLSSFIIHRYLADGLVEDALRLARHQFDQRPIPANWALLKTVASQNGNWPALRTILLDALRTKLDPASARVRSLRGGNDYAPDRSMLVELLIADGDAETAWQEANLGPCHEGVWLKLATLREKEHPADTIAIYQRLATSALQLTGKSYYKRAIEHIRPAVRLLKASRGVAAANSYLDELRETYKRRPAFVEMLDKLR